MTSAHLHPGSSAPAPVRAIASSGEMASLVQALLQALDPPLHHRILWPFDTPERQNWHYVPRPREGVPLRAMNEAGRARVRDLLAFSLSEAGLDRAERIMALEEPLGLMEGRPDYRDPLNYSVTVFGEPRGHAPWGWRIEGHHLSLNFTARQGEMLGVAPIFFGSNPARVPDGYPMAGERVLGPESDLGFSLIRALDETTRADAIIQTTSMGDIVAKPGRERILEQREGLPLARMAEPERKLALTLITSWARALRNDLADVEVARILEAGTDELRFAWAGPIDGIGAHYYRFHGPITLLEFDNTQNDVNHIHTVWHDLERNFGEDLLLAHYESGGHTHR